RPGEPRRVRRLVGADRDQGSPARLRAVPDPQRRLRGRAVRFSQGGGRRGVTVTLEEAEAALRGSIVYLTRNARFDLNVVLDMSDDEMEPWVKATSDLIRREIGK